MGNEQHKQQSDNVVQQRELTVNIYVVKNQEYEHQLGAAIERINAEPDCLASLSLLPLSEERWKAGKIHLHVVKSIKMIAVLHTNRIQSDIQLLSFLSNTLCRQLSEREVCCWFELNHKELRCYGGVPSSCQLAVDDIAFGTLKSAVRFVTVCTQRTTAASSDARYWLQFDKRKIEIMKETGERLFRLEMEYTRMHRIIHVVRREDHFDVYFQLRQSPYMYECVNVDAAEENWRFSRRSYIDGVTSEEIGRCDVIRVSFSVSVQETNLQDMFSNLPVADSWELRFAWIQDGTTSVVAVDETKLNHFAVLYASKVLQSVGLRCQLIDCLQLLEDIPESLHENLLYAVAGQYENESEYYLIDINRVIEQWRQSLKPNRRQSKNSMEITTVFLTPTRVVFRRPSAAYESNRVLRTYFADDRHEYVMKVYFRDENFLQNEGKNLHFIPLLYVNGSLDDEVLYTRITLGQNGVCH